MGEVEPTPDDLRAAGGNGFTPKANRVLPQSTDAEKGVLSSFLIAPREIGGFCVQKQITKEHFSIASYGYIYETLLGMWDKNEPIDFITLTQILSDMGQLDRCGGAAFITELFTYLPSAANAPYYIEILEEKAALRRALGICCEYHNRVYADGDSVWGMIDDLEQEVMAIRHKRAKIEIVHPKQLVIGAVQRIEQMYDRRGELSGLSTGFSALDRMNDGLHSTQLTVIAARPSMGKTAIAMNMVEHMTTVLGKSVGVFSLEMSKEQLMQRLICSRARINLARVRDGMLSERDFPAISLAASHLSAAKIWIDDSSSLTIQEIRGRARWMMMQYKIDALFVDYLQLIGSNSQPARQNREREVAEVSSGLKGIAKELKIPVVVLAQLSRFDKTHTKGAYPRPRLSDLRESGAIEQDADEVMLLTRDEFYVAPDDEDELARVRGKATVIIAKQRNGPVCDIPLTFISEYARFETRARSSDDEEPPAEDRSADLNEVPGLEMEFDSAGH